MNTSDSTPIGRFFRAVKEIKEGVSGKRQEVFLKELTDSIRKIKEPGEVERVMEVLKSLSDGADSSLVVEALRSAVSEVEGECKILRQGHALLLRERHQTSLPFSASSKEPIRLSD